MKDTSPKAHCIGINISYPSEKRTIEVAKAILAILKANCDETTKAVALTTLQELNKMPPVNISNVEISQ